MKHYPMLFAGLSLILPAQRSAAAYQIKTIVPGMQLTQAPVVPAALLSPSITPTSVVGPSVINPAMNLSAPEVAIQGQTPIASQRDMLATVSASLAKDNGAATLREFFEGSMRDSATDDLLTVPMLEGNRPMSANLNRGAAFSSEEIQTKARSFTARLESSGLFNAATLNTSFSMPRLEVRAKEKRVKIALRESLRSTTWPGIYSFEGLAIEFRSRQKIEEHTLEDFARYGESTKRIVGILFLHPGAVVGTPEPPISLIEKDNRLRSDAREVIRFLEARNIQYDVTVGHYAVYAHLTLKDAEEIIDLDAPILTLR